MRTVLLGLLGLVLAVAVGLGVHVLTRGTISLPVVPLVPAPALAPPAARTTRGLATTQRTETEQEQPRTTQTTARAGTGDDNSGRGRGRGRSGDDSGGNSGRGGGDD